jgi:hypothetical protein
MATTPNYGWVTPAPTDFVTDLPADFEVFADAVDADLVGLLGGTTGQVLTKVSGTDHDFAFAAAPSPSPNAWTLVNSGGTTLTAAATITISGLGSYNDLFIYIKEASSVSASSFIEFQFNSDADGHNQRGSVILGRDPTIGVGQLVVASQDDTNHVDFSRISTAAAGQSSGYIFVHGASQAGIKPFHFVSANTQDGGVDFRNFYSGGFYDDAAGITTFSLISGTGNFDNGTLFVYGR